jgi:microcystin-dependent protein
MNYYLGQIGIFGFNFAPKGWALASGSIISIAQNTALFSLLGTTYGGNGQTTFGLPDLRGRTPLHFDQTYPMGEMFGLENVTLLTTEMPAHRHSAQAVSVNGNAAIATDHTFAVAVNGAPPGTPQNAYTNSAPNTMLSPLEITTYGGNQPHNNQQPSLTINFCIATTGYYPARN